MKFAIVLVPLAIVLSVFLLTPQAAPVVLAQPSGWVELIGERTRTGKSFFDPSMPGFRLVEVSVAKVHYDGPTWKDIDNDLVPSIANVPTLGLVDLEMTTDDYEFYALQTLNTIPLWLYLNKSVPDVYVTFNPQGVGWTNDIDDVDLISMPQSVIGTVTDNRLHWEYAYGPGINLTLSAQPGRLAKFLTLEAMPRAPAQYILDGGNPSFELQFIFGTPSGPDAPDIWVDGVEWDQSSRTDTVGEVVFKSSGQFLFAFAAPIAFDSRFDMAQATFLLTKQGPNLRVGIRVPLSFLENATYPVTIDPTTVDEQVIAGADDGYSLDCCFDAVGQNVFSGRDAGANSYDGWARFQTVNIPTGQTVSSANISVFATLTTTDGDDVFTNLYLNDADDAAAPTNRADHVAKARTTNFVAWDEEDFVVDVETWSPDFTATVQEVIERGGWAANNDMMLLWDDDNTLVNDKIYRLYSYENDNTKAIQLHIVYESWQNTGPSITNPVNFDRTNLDEDYARTFSATDPDANQTLQWELNATNAPFVITVWNGGNRTTWVNATPDEDGSFYVNVTVGDAATTGNTTDFVNYTLVVTTEALTDVQWVEVIFISIMFFFLTALGFAIKYAWPLLFVAGLIGILEGIWLISLTQFGFIGLTFIAPGTVVIILGVFKMYDEVT